MVYVLAALAAFFYGACCLMLGYMLSCKQTNVPIKLPRVIKAMERSIDPDAENKIRVWENIDNYGTNKPQRDFVRGDK